MFYYTCTSGIESYILIIVQSAGTVGDTVTMIITRVINCTQVMNQLYNIIHHTQVCCSHARDYISVIDYNYNKYT